MTLQQILYFLEITHTQNFTQAANNLFVAQSSLSHSIQSLEDEIGVPLFIRKSGKSGKRVLLTKYGEALLPYARRVIDDMNEGQETINKLRNPNYGITKIVLSYTNCFSLVSMVLNKFYKEHSYNDIAVRCTVIQTHYIFEKDVVAGNYDLAFSGTASFDELNSIPIARERLYVMLPINHPLSKAAKLSLHDIKDEQLLVFSQNWNLSLWIANMFEECGLHQNVLEYFNDWASQMAYVAMGLGVAIMPHLPVDPNRIACIPLDHSKHIRPIYMHWAKNRPLSPTSKYVKQYFIDYVKDKNIIV